MHYIGRVATDVARDLKEKLGYKGDWAPCNGLALRDSEVSEIRLQGFFMRDDVFADDTYHPMPPSFWSLFDNEYIDYAALKNTIILEDFQSAEKWIELYKRELKKYDNR